MRGKHILVVEDEAEILRTLVEALKEEGALVIGIGNGADAVAELNRQSFDLVISDVLMPGTDGYALLKAIKLSAKVPVPLIFISGNSDLSLERALALGAVGLVKKPFGLTQLMNAINSVWCPT